MKDSFFKRSIRVSIITSISLTVAVIVMLKMPNNLSRNTTIIFAPDTSIRAIAEQLAVKNIIRFPELFILYVYVTQNQGYLLSGEYQIAAKSSIMSIATLMRKGSNILYKLTATEGMRAKNIIELVNNHPKLDGDNVAALYPEGSLAPNTYQFKYGDKKDTIIANMHQEMQQIRVHIAQYLPQLTTKYPAIRSVDDVITLASIVEMEAKFDEERPLIAAVFLNRLNKHMHLQADPTVVYAIETSTTRQNVTLSKKDLKFASPYNTYKNKGLPPGPISCPGFKAITAVLNPANVNYLYFVSNNNGGHNFASNLTTHNNNVRLYRTIKQKAMRAIK